jgi:hypothetical protein
MVRNVGRNETHGRAGMNRGQAREAGGMCRSDAVGGVGEGGGMSAPA